MANYKVVDADQLDADLASLADSIRAKAGTTEQMAFPEGFKSAVDGIQTGGGTGNIPLAATTEFGRERTSEEYQVPTGKSYYNGVLLPDIPADVLAEYPYAWIRKNADGGYYNLVLAAYPWYFNDGMNCSGGESAPEPWYDVEISKAETVSMWTFNKNTTGSFGISGTRTVLWANHDIPNGSATATDVYFDGTEAVQQLETKNNYAYGDYVANSENYAVANEAINEIAHRMQKRYSTYDLFTGAEVRDFIERCDFLEKGNAVSVLKMESVVFESSAFGRSLE